jgi:hypothetical protein
MSCCGKKREAIRQRTISVIPSPEPTTFTGPRTPLVFRGAGAYLVAGPNSREVYHFSSAQPEQWVHTKDAPALLKTGLFRAKTV